MNISTAKDLFTEAEKKEIVKAIQDAERRTSGEIRIHLEDVCKEDVLDHTAFIFEQLKMHKTKHRNGVLFYISVKDHQFAIIGDKGINEVVPKDFWESIKTAVLKDFVIGNYCKGLKRGIALAGDKLHRYFPVEKNDVNQLSDDISYG